MKQIDPFAPFQITKPTQLREKSNQWFDETEFLYEERHYNVALYLGGFVIECLLKSALWSRRFEDQVRRLIYASHNLADLLEANQRLAAQLRHDRTGQYERFTTLATWTVRFRYNPRRVDADTAETFMIRLREVRKWLLSRI